MNCQRLSYTDMVGFVAGDLDEKALARVSAHLDEGCDACASEIVTLDEVRRLAVYETLPPPWVLRRAVALAGDGRLGRLLEPLYRVAEMILEVARGQRPVGVRRGESAGDAGLGRQMMFVAGDYAIDVRMRPAGRGRVSVTGQVLPPVGESSAPVAGSLVTIVHADRGTASCVTSEPGAFEFASLDEGEYSLLVSSAETDLLVECLLVRFESV